MRHRLQNQLLRALQAALALVALACVLAQPSRAQEPVTLSTLPNGLRVITAPSHAVGLAAIDVWVRAGTSRQPIGQPGLAHYLEHIIFKGTPTRPEEEQIDSDIEDLGGSFNAATSYDWAHFYVEVPSANFAPALGVIGDVIQHATISDKAVQSERPIILSEVARSLDSPETIMTAHVRSMVYGPEHPYGGLVTGTPADVQAITRDEILAFYKTYYVPGNVTLVVTGDVTNNQVQKEAAKVFGDWPTAARPDAPDLPAVPLLTTIHRTVLRRFAPSTFMTIAFDAPAVTDKPDAWTMDVVLTLLGQGANNRLDHALHHDLKLVDHITSDYLTQRNRGILTVTASFPSGDPATVEAAIINQVNLVRDKLASQADLDAAKQSLLASYLFDVQTDSGRANALGFYDMIDDYKYDVDYVAHFQSVTAEDVQRVAQKYLTPDKYNIVTIVPFTDPSSASVPSDGGPLRMASY